MKLCYLRSIALLASITLIAGGCQSLTPGENAAVFGGASGVAAGALARAAGLSTAQSIATGAAVGAVVAATTYIIAKHQASVRQRRIAEQRARAYYARMSETRKVSMKKKRVRYIAVDTEKDQRTSPRAKKSVMIWDTQTQEVVGNEVYDVESTPAQGTTAKFDTYAAEYAGIGS
ncbi:MAG TPA: hypothetical protein VFV83_10140 [Chthoniobacteraceae bacterium]|nr:hypothetical protein [Chthoniobacteraceae bacterium]